MGYLGEKQRNEAIRFHLTLDTVPTGTPQVAVEQNGASILAATNMTQGTSTLDWYYDYTTGGSTTVGAYQVKFSAVVDGTTKYAYDEYDVMINDSDDIKTDTETIIANIGVSSGACAIVFNVSDGANPVINAKLSVHNSSNDDSPLFGALTTNALGDTGIINLDDGTYKVRISKAGAIVSEVKTATITASATINYTVTTITVTQPSDPDLCRLYLYPITLSNADVTGLTINISSQDALTKISGEFVKNTESTFTYDNSTSPDSYYFDAVQGAEVHITCEELGINHDITVPAVSTKDLTSLIS